jgi:hypothetical protein
MGGVSHPSWQQVPLGHSMADQFQETHCSTGACRAVNIKHKYGVLGSGANLIVRRAWVLVCVLLFAVWISIDVGAGTAASLVPEKTLTQVLLPKWPADTLLASLLEPYSIKQQSVEFVKEADQLPDGSSSKDGIQAMCACTFTDPKHQAAVLIPYVGFATSDSVSAASDLPTAWRLLNLCNPHIYNTSSKEYSTFQRLENATKLYEKYATDISYQVGCAPTTSIQLQQQAWKTAMFLELNSES